MVGKTKGNSKTAAKKKSSRRFRWFRFFMKLALVGIVLFSLLFGAVWIGLFGRIPSKTELNRVKTPLASEVISADGKLLGRYYVENRSYVSFEEISPNIINALIATEDARFFKHRGIDEIALLRVFVKTLLLQDRSAGGGSTLSQQIAKNLYPRKKIGLLTLPVSKIREAIIAYRLEKIYSKEEILTLYLNTVPFGENIFGIALASERFFSKRPVDVSIPEAAVLVGILKANQLFNPRLHPDRSLERRNLVLDLMVKNGFIDKAKGNSFKEMPLGLRYSLITFNQGPAPYLLEHIRPDLMEWCQSHTKENGDPWNLFTDGLKIHTTVDSRMQRYAVSAVNEQMKLLQKEFDVHWQGKAPWGKNQEVVIRAMHRSDRWLAGKRAGRSIKEVTKSFSEETDITLFTWDGLKTSKMSPLDSLKHYLKMLNAGMLVLENRSGAVKAWVGGIDFRFFKYDYIRAARQTGSTFKPFVFLAALENGLSPLDYYSCEEQTYEEFDNWTPGNASDKYSGYYTMRAALAKSINTVTVDIGMQTGISNTVETARDLGIKSELPEVPSLVLGVASVPLSEMVPAYAAIANGGKVVKPHMLVRIEDKSGKILAEFEAPEADDSGIDPENCRLVTNMLQYAVESGTGAAIRSRFGVRGDFAGKTGTTQEYADGWFIGYTPDFTAGCWVGADDPAVHFRTLALGGGSHTALPVVGRFFSRVLSDPGFSRYAANRFEQPDSLMMNELLAMADHVENVEHDFNFFGLFGKKRTRAAAQEAGPEVKPDRQPSDTPEKKDAEPVWEKIKRIFRKK